MMSQGLFNMSLQKKKNSCECLRFEETRKKESLMCVCAFANLVRILDEHVQCGICKGWSAAGVLGTGRSVSQDKSQICPNQIFIKTVSNFLSACLKTMLLPEANIFNHARTLFQLGPNLSEQSSNSYCSGKNVYLPVFCFEGLISEFPKFTYRIPSLRASFSSQVKKNRKPD